MTGEEKPEKKNKSKEDKNSGRRGVLVLLLVTTLVSLLLYLKQKVSFGEGFSLSWPKIGGSERIIFEK